MTRLELAVALAQEAGIASTGPSTTVGQMGEMKRVVDWIDRAYKYIQNKNPLWLFLKKEFSFNTTASTGNCAASTIASDFASWQEDSFRIYLAATGVSDEQIILYVPWHEFRDFAMIGSQRTDTGRPHLFSIKPDKSVQLFPVPDDTYTVVGEYYQTADVMTLDTDEPIFPARFHEAIMWQALKFYGAYSAEPDKYAIGNDEYNLLMAQMEFEQLPALQWGAPLA